MADLARVISEIQAKADGKTTRIEKQERGQKSIEELLSELDQLSEEQAQKLLTEELGSASGAETGHD